MAPRTCEGALLRKHECFGPLQGGSGLLNHYLRDVLGKATKNRKHHTMSAIPLLGMLSGTIYKSNRLPSLGRSAAPGRPEREIGFDILELRAPKQGGKLDITAERFSGRNGSLTQKANFSSWPSVCPRDGVVREGNYATA